MLGSTLNYEKGLKANGRIVLNAVGNTSGNGSEIFVNSTKDVNANVQLDGNIVVGKTNAAKVLVMLMILLLILIQHKILLVLIFLNSESYFYWSK